MLAGSGAAMKRAGVVRVRRSIRSLPEILTFSWWLHLKLTKYPTCSVAADVPGKPLHTRMLRYLHHLIPRLDVCKSYAKMGKLWGSGGLFKWHHVMWIPASFLFLTQNFFPFWLRRGIIGTPSLPGQAAQDLGRFTSANTFGH